MRLVFTMDEYYELRGALWKEFNEWIKKQPDPLRRNTVSFELLDECGLTLLCEHHLLDDNGKIVLWPDREGIVYTKSVVQCTEPVPWFVIPILQVHPS